MFSFPLKARQNIVHKIERLERVVEVLLAGLCFESLKHNSSHDLQVAVPEVPRLLARSYRRLLSQSFLIDAGEHLPEQLSELFTCQIKTKGAPNITKVGPKVGYSF